MPVSRCTQCGSPGASFSFDARRWTAADLIVGLATFLLAVALFRPGFGRPDGWPGGDFGGPSGVAADGYLWIVFGLSVGTLLLLFVRAGVGSVPGARAPGDRQLVVIAAGINLLLIALAIAPEGSEIRRLPLAAGVAALAALIAATWQLRSDLTALRSPPT